MADLLDQIDSARKAKSGESNTQIATSQKADVGTLVGGNAPSDSLGRGANILEGASSTPEVKTVVEEETNRMVKNPDDWSKESALKEVVKLREENKLVRTKFQEQLDKIEKETQARISAIEEESKSANEAKKRLEALEAEQADKKRSIEDKLANREARLAETEAVYKNKLDEKEKEVQSYKSKALQYEAEQEARRQSYRDRTKEELDKVPTEFRDFAERMVKGYEDPNEAWLAISEANRKGVFGEKKIVVNHAVPGANDGARVNNMKSAADEIEAKAKMSSRTLIQTGLAKAMKGENTAFRGR
jgi:hypothetical protein